VDGDFEVARERAVTIARQRGIRLVEDSLDIETCEGAATIGLELVSALSAGDAVLIALGGGASGVSKLRLPERNFRDGVVSGRGRSWNLVCGGRSGRRTRGAETSPRPGTRRRRP